MSKEGLFTVGPFLDDPPRHLTRAGHRVPRGDSQQTSRAAHRAPGRTPTPALVSSRRDAAAHLDARRTAPALRPVALGDCRLVPGAGHRRTRRSGAGRHEHVARDDVAAVVVGCRRAPRAYATGGRDRRRCDRREHRRGGERQRRRGSDAACQRPAGRVCTAGDRDRGRARPARAPDRHSAGGLRGPVRLPAPGHVLRQPLRLDRSTGRQPLLRRRPRGERL